MRLFHHLISFLLIAGISVCTLAAEETEVKLYNRSNVYYHTQPNNNIRSYSTSSSQFIHSPNTGIYTRRSTPSTYYPQHQATHYTAPATRLHQQSDKRQQSFSSGTTSSASQGLHRHTHNTTIATVGATLPPPINTYAAADNITTIEDPLSERRKVTDSPLPPFLTPIGDLPLLFCMMLLVAYTARKRSPSRSRNHD